jgi:hypothetical protein
VTQVTRLNFLGVGVTPNETKTLIERKREEEERKLTSE